MVSVWPGRAFKEGKCGLKLTEETGTSCPPILMGGQEIRVEKTCSFPLTPPLWNKQCQKNRAV